MDYHKASFEALASELGDYTKTCTISFLDSYKCNQKSLAGIKPAPFTEELVRNLAKSISDIAAKYNIKVNTCAEAFDLEELGIGHASCIDYSKIGKLIGNKIKYVKDKNQREECGCMPCVDIGQYNTCTNGCIYCYANHNKELTVRSHLEYNSYSPILCSKLKDTDVITNKKQETLKDKQLGLF